MFLKARVLTDKLPNRNGFLNEVSKVTKHRKSEVTEDGPSNLRSEKSAKNNIGDIDSWRAL